MKLIYQIENLDCPHCAAEIERAIQKLACIQAADLSFATKQLHVTAASEDGLLAQIQQAADAIEEGVVFRKREEGTHHTEMHSNIKRELPILAVGILLFVLGLLAEFLLHHSVLGHLFLLAAYLLMGWDILVDAVKGIFKKRFFDEKFLMCIATMGALFINCWEEAVGVILFFRIGQMFEQIAVERSRKTIMDAIDFRPETVRLLKNGEPSEIPASDVQVGDVLLVRVGDRIPVDGVILKGRSTVDTSAMTGESVPLEVGEEDGVMSGCINLSGVLEIEASATLKDSMVTRILESVENAAAGKPKIDRFITRFSQVYTPIVVIVAVLTAIVPSLITGDTMHWIYTALSFLMISCPCALVLSVPLAYFCGIGNASRRGILFKDGISLEILASVKAAVMDKTGTLTMGRLSVTSVIPQGVENDELLSICAAIESASVHPIAQSITEYARNKQLLLENASDVSEIAGKGVCGEYQGKRILCGNRSYLEEHGITIPMTEQRGTAVFVARDGVYIGCIVLEDTPKSNASAMVKKLKREGLHTVMLTGDHADYAQKIAYELQVDEVHAQLLPDEKLSHMNAIRNQHGAVLYVGDGINDTPVLSGADVGAAMGNGADAAMEVADILFLTSDPAAIVQAVRTAKRVNRTTKFIIAFALSVKLIIMLLGFMGFANMWLSVFADTGVTILCVVFILMRIYCYRSSV